MSGFSRTIKSPGSCLSPRRRPAMPGRTFSSSSERSFPIPTVSVSTASEDGVANSNSTTADAFVHQARRYHHQGTTPSHDAAQSGRANIVSSPSRNPASRHLVVDNPRVPRIWPAPVHTPTQSPTTARGDVAGNGYFPNHPDASPGRLQGQQHSAHSHAPFSEEVSATTDTPNGSTRQFRTASLSRQDADIMGSTNIPVASYFPTGYQDTPLPIGKYYPSNYETANGNGDKVSSAPATTVTSPRSPATSGLSGPGSSGMVTASVGPTSATESEARQRIQLQQYQLDMMAQASRAASDVVGASGSPADSAPQLGPRTFMGLPGLDARFGTPGLHKPTSPRLHPLGSPGPVTPMELEEAGSDGYLDRGKDSDRRTPQGLAPPAKEIPARSM